MAKTVEAGFAEFDEKLLATELETETIATYRVAIQACLRRSFGVTRFFKAGSQAHGTAVPEHSDADYFATIPSSHLKENSEIMLRDMHDALVREFPNKGIAVRTPAILVPMGKDSSDWTEIFPVRFLEEESSNEMLYQIADGSGGWKTTYPDAITAYINRVDVSVKHQARPLIRFMKAWKYYRYVPISSFYLEMRAVKYAADEQVIFYSTDIRTIFREIWESDLVPMQDPLGLSGTIDPCSGLDKRAELTLKLHKAMTDAERARDAEAAGNLGDAFHWWNLVFAGHFPSYG